MLMTISSISLWLLLHAVFSQPHAFTPRILVDLWRIQYNSILFAEENNFKRMFMYSLEQLKICGTLKTTIATIKRKPSSFIDQID